MGKVFGGYTDISWKSVSMPGRYAEGNKQSFLFSLNKDQNFDILKCQNKQKEVYHYSDYLCCFGWGAGFYLRDNCNLN